MIKALSFISIYSLFDFIYDDTTLKWFKLIIFIITVPNLIIDIFDKIKLGNFFITYMLNRVINFLTFNIYSRNISVFQRLDVLFFNNDMNWSYQNIKKHIINEDIKYRLKDKSNEFTLSDKFKIFCKVLLFKNFGCNNGSIDIQDSGYYRFNTIFLKESINSNEMFNFNKKITGKNNIEIKYENDYIDVFFNGEYEIYKNNYIIFALKEDKLEINEKLILHFGNIKKQNIMKFDYFHKINDDIIENSYMKTFCVLNENSAYHPDFYYSITENKLYHQNDFEYMVERMNLPRPYPEIIISDEMFFVKYKSKKMSNSSFRFLTKLRQLLFPNNFHFKHSNKKPGEKFIQNNKEYLVNLLNENFICTKKVVNITENNVQNNENA